MLRGVSSLEFPCDFGACERFRCRLRKPRIGVGICSRFAVARTRVRGRPAVLAAGGNTSLKPALNADADARLAKTAVKSFTCAEIGEELEARDPPQHGERKTGG